MSVLTVSSVFQTQPRWLRQPIPTLGKERDSQASSQIIKIAKTTTPSLRLLKIASKFLTPSLAKKTYNEEGVDAISSALILVDSIFGSKKMLDLRRERDGSAGGVAGGASETGQGD